VVTVISAEQPNQKWIPDIAYVWIAKGWLSAVIDLSWPRGRLVDECQHDQRNWLLTPC
jgi:hypothetical protein